MGDDDFLSLISESLFALPDDKQQDAAPQPVADDEPPELLPDELDIMAPPADDTPAPVVGTATGKLLLYVGFDAATSTNFQQNFEPAMQVYMTADLPEIKRMIESPDVGLIVFDPSSFIKPGIAITRYIKEKGIRIPVAHVYSEARITEEYAKYKQYHLHLQPDFEATTDETFVVINEIKNALGLS